MARLLIIITSESYELWSKTQNWKQASVTDGPAYRCALIDEALVVIFCHPVGEENEQKNATTKWVKTLVSNRLFTDYSEVYIASHKERVEWNDEDLKNRLNGKADFDHGDLRNEVYKSILGLLDSPLIETLDAVIKAMRPPPKVEAYSDVMHNLAMGYKSGAEAAIEQHGPDIHKTSSHSEREEWEEIKKKIKQWDPDQRDVEIETLNEKFFKFAKKELIEHYPYLSDLE